MVHDLIFAFCTLCYNRKIFHSCLSLVIVAYFTLVSRQISQIILHIVSSLPGCIINNSMGKAIVLEINVLLKPRKSVDVFSAVYSATVIPISRERTLRKIKYGLSKSKALSSSKLTQLK